MEFRSQKGINIITLSVAIIILVLITSVLVYNTKDGVRIRNLKDLYNDVEALDNKISAYYIQHGDIPKLDKYTNLAFLDNANYEEINPNNGADYYVIDLKELSGVTLNYGKDYDKIVNAPEGQITDVYNLKDIYIVNEASHTVYYPRGVDVQGIRYYTYGEEWKKVDLSVIPISTAEQLSKIGTDESVTINGSNYKFTKDATYVIKSDIDLSGICHKVDGTTANDVSWTPLCSTKANAFTGKLYGNGHEIRGLYINTTADYQGLFGYNDGTIQDITVEGNVTSTGRTVGGIVAKNNSNGKILNSISKVSVTVLYIVGGICSENNGTVSNCKNFNKIESTKENDNSGCTGGIVGVNKSSGKIEKSTNYGKIIAKSNCIGGINGYNEGGKIYLCSNNGTVNSNRVATGGIVGFNAGESNRIICCYNIEKISNYNTTGGIVGRYTGGNIISCYSIGEVSGTSNIKSIIGYKNTTDTIARNNFYLNTLPTTDENATPKSMQEMMSQAFVDLLNQGQPDQPWAMDTKGINNGYPVLKWQLEELK